ALLTSLVYAVLCVPLLTFLPLVLAILVEKQIPFISAFRTTFYFPVIASVVVVGLIFTWLFDSRGVVNEALAFVGLIDQPLPLLLPGDRRRGGCRPDLHLAVRLARRRQRGARVRGAHRPAAPLPRQPLGHHPHRDPADGLEGPGLLHGRVPRGARERGQLPPRGGRDGRRRSPPPLLDHHRPRREGSDVPGQRDGDGGGDARVHRAVRALGGLGRPRRRRHEPGHAGPADGQRAPG